MRPELLDRPARILIVDDQRHNRQVLEVMLAAEGYSLLTAESGEEALVMVARQSPDLVLLDAMMPGMNGYQVASRIKADPATSSIPVIMVSALDDRDARLRGLTAGAEDFLAKPVDRAELCVRVRNLLRLKRSGDDHGESSLQICPSCRRCYDHTTATCPEDGAALGSPRPLPYLLLGRYRFLQVLGQGGMGVVLSAHDQKLDRDVAIKLVRPEDAGNAEMTQRFVREAHAVARIQHPGVIELHDSGELNDGTAFLVMERLAGCDLRLLLKKYGRGKPAQVARLVRQACAALHAAHRAGVIHRDVKPENVFLVDDPSGFRVKLLDFGIAKSTAFDSALTQRGMVLGTPEYMAPERARGEEVDSRTDVYSFAAVAYEALTGRRAVQADDPARVFTHVLKTVPPPVSSLVPGIPPEIDAAFASALAKDPADRMRDIELWGSSFVELLETIPGDRATVGWPASSSFCTPLHDSRLEPETALHQRGTRRVT